MHSFWKQRIFVYSFTLLILLGVCCDPHPFPRGTLLSQSGFYLGFYGVPFLFWIGVFELFYRIVRPRSKKNSVRD